MLHNGSSTTIISPTGMSRAATRWRPGWFDPKSENNHGFASAIGEDSLLVFIPTFFIRLGDKNGIRQSGIIKIGAGDLWNLLLLCLEVDIQVILEGNTE